MYVGTCEQRLIHRWWCEQAVRSARSSAPLLQSWPLQSCSGYPCRCRLRGSTRRGRRGGSRSRACRWPHLPRSLGSAARRAAEGRAEARDLRREKAAPATTAVLAGQAETTRRVRLPHPRPRRSSPPSPPPRLAHTSRTLPAARGRRCLRRRRRCRSRRRRRRPRARTVAPDRRSRAGRGGRGGREARPPASRSAHCSSERDRRDGRPRAQPRRLGAPRRRALMCLRFRRNEPT